MFVGGEASLRLACGSAAGTVNRGSSAGAALGRTVCCVLGVTGKGAGALAIGCWGVCGTGEIGAETGVSTRCPQLLQKVAPDRSSSPQAAQLAKLHQYADYIRKPSRANVTKVSLDADDALPYSRENPQGGPNGQ